MRLSLLPLASMAFILLSASATSIHTAGRRAVRVPFSAFHHLPPPATAALLARSSHSSRQQQPSQRPSSQQSHTMAALSAIRGGAFGGFSFFSSSSRLLASNFGYPDAAEEAVGKAQSYLQAFIEAPEPGRPVVRA